MYGCSGMEQPMEPISKDGRYSVETYKTENGIIVLTIKENGREIQSINTGASIYQKFAVGWFKEEAILVLYSSDIGVLAWSAKSNFKSELGGAKYTTYGNELYEAKYGKKYLTSERDQ